MSSHLTKFQIYSKSNMTEKLQLPNPAPKSTEHEKWQAMIESVIEFISASRTMLQVLNQRVKDSQKYKEAEKKKIEDEKTKLAFYKDCLHMEVNKKKIDSKLAGTESVNETLSSSVKEGGDSISEKVNSKNCHGRVENNGDKLSQASVEMEKLDSAEKSKEIDQPQIKENQHHHHHHHHRETCKKFTHFKNSQEKLCIKNLKESDTSECKLHKPFHVQISSGEENINKLPPTVQTSQAETIQKNDHSTSNLTSKVISHQQHGKPKCLKISKIPRAKSFSDEKNQCMLNERAPAEGNKKYQRQPTYSYIHLKKISQL